MDSHSIFICIKILQSVVVGGVQQAGREAVAQSRCPLLTLEITDLNCAISAGARGCKGSKCCRSNGTALCEVHVNKTEAFSEAGKVQDSFFIGTVV